MRHSIFLKITLLFAFALVSFFAFSFYFIKFQKDAETRNSTDKARQVDATLKQLVAMNGSLESIQKILHDFGFEVTENQKVKEDILSRAPTPFFILPNRFPGILNIIFPPRILIINNELYVLLEAYGKITLYKDASKTHQSTYYLITFVGIFLLVFVFILVIQSLLPLKKLRSQIKLFANGDNNVECSIKQQDEIGELAREFNNAIQKIDALGKSRALFLRSIMHELKTPITKGRITAEMIDSNLHKERLISVFKRLQTLIDEFAKIEQLTSKNLNINKQEFLLQDIIEHTKKMLLIDNLEADPIILNTPNDIIKVDFELFTMALKNLLDNAIKYGSDKKVYVESKYHNLIISNRGEALKKDFNEYFKPYFKDDSERKAKQGGFGLGMYIIKNTLEAQNFEISYAHIDGINHFTIHNCIVENFCPVPQKSQENKSQNIRKS